MWYNTRVTKLLGIDYPVMLGPFGGGLSSVELTSAVSNAGGLGGYGAYTMSPKEIYETDKQIKAATGKPYNLNLWVSDTDAKEGFVSEDEYENARQIFQPYFDELGIAVPSKPPAFQSRFENQLQVVFDIKPKVFSFMFGVLPPDVMELLAKHGIKTVGAATTLDEAIALEKTGVDMIIASGFEAGGHRPSFLDQAEASTMGTFVLVQLIREKVKTPVIAAGGIANGRGVAGALTLGADAVQIGTAFLACEESGALPVHREMLFSGAAKYTTLSRAFTGRLGRGLTSRIAKDVLNQQNPYLSFPLQTTFMAPLRKAALEQHKLDMVLFWGGQISPLLKHRKASELMQSVIKETSDLLAK